jgi:hypothetical protein
MLPTWEQKTPDPQGGAEGLRSRGPGVSIGAAYRLAGMR